MSKLLIATVLMLGLGLVFGVGPPALGQQGTEIKVSASLFCNKVEEVEAVITAKDKQAALAAVNATDHVCAVGQYAYFGQQDIKTVENDDGLVTIRSVLIVGVNYGQGLVPLSGPVLQFIASLTGPKPAGLAI